MRSQLRRRNRSSEETTQKQEPTPAKTPSPEQDTENQEPTPAKPSFTGAELPVLHQQISEAMSPYIRESGCNKKVIITCLCGVI